MAKFISEFGGWVGIITAVIVGGVALYGVLSKNTKLLRKEETDTAKDVIGLLSSKVDILESKVEELQVEVKDLRAENKTLRDVLQGRDDKTQKFYNDAYAAIEVIKHNDKVSEENAKTLSKIAALLEAVLKTKNS